MEIMDVVMEQLNAAEIAVILDNHVSDSGWCCSYTDGNGLWYTNNYTAQNWFDDWTGIVDRLA